MVLFIQLDSYDYLNRRVSCVAKLLSINLDKVSVAKHINNMSRKPVQLKT